MLKEILMYIIVFSALAIIVGLIKELKGDK